MNAGDAQLFSDSHTFEPEFDNGIEGNVSAQLIDESGFINDNLVEMPKITPYTEILHTQQVKKINIRKLKAIMWSKLQTMYNDINENNYHVEDDIEDNPSRNSLHINYEPIKFTQFYIELPDLLSMQEAEGLSFAIAYTTLLQLANEKNLQLSNEEDVNDINIFLS